MTNHKLIIGNCMSMAEIEKESIHLMVTSPPYFNAPFDYKGLFKDYEQYLGVLKNFAKETYRVLKEGRIAVLNIDLRYALSKKSVFILNSNKKHFAISWWVSAKRTRSYP